MGESIADRLDADDGPATVSAFPDGSVDHFYDVYDGDERVRRRERFVETVSSRSSPAFTVDRTAVEPGGHAVNMALQADALGDDVTLVGNLDHPVLADLSFETVSMGEPARVSVYEFDEGDVLMAEPAAAVDDWALADLRTAAGEAFPAFRSADVVFCTNWTSFDALPSALTDLAAEAADGNYFLFDPGSLSARRDAEMRRLVDALADLGGSYDVVLAANGGEMDALAAGALGGPAPADRATAAVGVRDAADLAGAVVHEDDAAVAATSSGTVRVGNFDIDPVRHTGGGDRFDAGLAHALARGWDWADALRLANACAARYIATGESATPDELAAFLRERE